MGKRALQKRRAVGPDDWVMGTPPRRGGQDKHKTPPVQILRRGVAPPSSPSSGGASPVRKRGGSHSGSPYSSPIHRTHPHSSTATHPHIPTHTLTLTPKHTFVRAFRRLTPKHTLLPTGLPRSEDCPTERVGDESTHDRDHSQDEEDVPEGRYGWL